MKDAFKDINKTWWWTKFFKGLGMGLIVGSAVIYLMFSKEFLKFIFFIFS